MNNRHRRVARLKLEQKKSYERQIKSFIECVWNTICASNSNKVKVLQE